MATTATEWLLENPDDIEALGEMLMGVEDLPIRLWTELPEWMKQRIAERLKETYEQPYWDNIYETTRGDAERVLNTGLQEGWSIRRMAEEMQESLGGDYYAMVRAKNIARTESGNALNGARKFSMDRLQEDLPELPMRPEWLSVLGTTTRADHANLDGVPADKDSTWSLEGKKIPWPGHFSLSAGQRCNCQCSIIMGFGVTDTEAQQIIQDYYSRDESILGKSYGQKHLPGQHDQSTHGHGGGGSSQIPKPPDDLSDDAIVKIMLDQITNGDWDYVSMVANKGKGSLAAYAEELLDYHRSQVVSSEQHIAGSKLKPDGVTVDADTWTKSGGTLGTQPGGKFKAPDGEEYYVKFPSDPQVARNEVAAAKLYALTGAGVRDTFLVEKDGKVGVAAKWDENLTKANFDKAEDRDVAASDFAVHAWTANWDCVGAGYENPMDNIRFKGQGGDKQAIMLDPGGALFYSGKGTPKLFSYQASEWNSLRDASINPSAAKVFGKMTDEQLIESGKKVIAVSDELIDKVCSQYNLPDMAAAKLRSRRNYIENKVQELEKKLQTGQPTSKEVEETTTPTGEKVSVSPKDGAVLPPPSFLPGKSQGPAAINNKLQNMYNLAAAGKWKELESIKVKADGKDSYTQKVFKYKQQLLSCKDGGADLISKPGKVDKPTIQTIKINEQLFPAKPEFVSSNQANVQTNSKLADEALGYAKAGDIDSLKAMTLTLSPKLQGFHAELVSNLSEQLNPPPPLQNVSGTIKSISEKCPPLVGGGGSKVAKYVALGVVDDLTTSGVKLSGKWYGTSDSHFLEEVGTARYSAKLSEDERYAVRMYTGQAYSAMNKQLRGELPLDSITLNAANAVMKASVNLPQGLKLSRHIELGGSNLDNLEASVGKVLQDRGIISTSFVTDKWPGNVHVQMTVGPGVKGLPADGFSFHQGEHEVLLPPNTRMVVTKVEKGPHNSEIRIEATILPTDPKQCCPP